MSNNTPRVPEKLELSDGLIEQIKKLVKQFEGKGLAVIEYEFDGEGDDGQIWETRFLDDTNQDVGLRPKNHDTNQLGYDILECWGYDWCNNEGGSGTVRIHIGPPIRVEVDGGQKETTTSDLSAEITL